MSHLFRRHRRFVAGIEEYTTSRGGNGSQALIACKRAGCLWSRTLDFSGLSKRAVARALKEKRPYIGG